MELLTVREVSDLLRLRPKTVYDWAARGKLPCLRIGNRLRFDRGSLLRWLEARKEG